MTKYECAAVSNEHCPYAGTGRSRTIDRAALLDAMKRTKAENERIVQNAIVGRPAETRMAEARIAVLGGYISLIEVGFFDSEVAP
jgi:hypothetical protein